MNQFVEHDIVHIPDASALPADAFSEKELLTRRNIQSLIAIPLRKNNRSLGFIELDVENKKINWKVNQFKLLKVIANTLSDALIKVEADKEINKLAYFDALTGLPNRVFFKNRLDYTIALAKRSESLVGVMFIDLDGFKSINDTLGHDYGDEMLKMVAQRLTQNIRNYDSVARFGGDEFLIIFPQLTSLEGIHTISKGIVNAFEKPITINNQDFFISASAGIALYPIDGEDTESLIKNADLAMYASKSNGKNRYTFCSPEMKADVFNLMKMTNFLYRALERNELFLHYQPQINTKTHEIIGYEALIRWENPELGSVPPSSFIPLAEQTGLINAIGEWVLQTACIQNKTWQDMGFPKVSMAVNLSVEQFRNNGLFSFVQKALKISGLDPQYLDLEITESIAIKENDYIINTLNALKTLGVSLSIDDFGTEYSSLSRLKDLPVDRLKIAMQFIHGITKNKKDESIINVIIHLAKSFDLKVIAEGVETEAQLSFLRSENCDEIQGYYFYKPMSAHELEIILKK